LDIDDLSAGIFLLLSAVITEAEEGGFVAFNPESGTTTQGETYQEAIQNLKEATSLYLEEFQMKIHSHPVMTTFEIGHQNCTSKPQI
jgi:predicted RNase H-like HicB family nuclease